MNWHEFRKHHFEKFGPTPLYIVSQRYQNYKKSLVFIEIYSKPTCPYCIKAKQLLKKLKLKYKEYDVNISKYKKEMILRTNNAKTVPQIFIKGHLIGGYDNLYVLYNQGRLNKLIK